MHARPGANAFRPVEDPEPAHQVFYQLLLRWRLCRYLPEYGAGRPDLHRALLPARKKERRRCYPGYHSDRWLLLLGHPYSEYVVRHFRRGAVLPDQKGKAGQPYQYPAVFYRHCPFLQRDAAALPQYGSDRLQRHRRGAGSGYRYPLRSVPALRPGQCSQGT